MLIVNKGLELKNVFNMHVWSFNKPNLFEKFKIGVSLAIHSHFFCHVVE